MAIRRTNQEWQDLLTLYETSSLTKRAFFQQHTLSPSTFYAKRQQFKSLEKPSAGSFVKAHVIEKHTQSPSCQATISNMTLSVNEIKLSIPQGTSAQYLAELIGALS